MIAIIIANQQPMHWGEGGDREKEVAKILRNTVKRGDRRTDNADMGDLTPFK